MQQEPIEDEQNKNVDLLGFEEPDQEKKEVSDEEEDRDRA